MVSISLVELISSRKWEQALFTTYALSLTFFETCVLRELRQQGCRQIYLITDADGYQSSLGERRSTRVGHEYRVIPVALPKGVFHPKCIYLSGPDGDALVIGSGNITFGGYGRNLEVFEILEPETAPAAFGEFADFLDSLGNRDDFVIPDKTWIPQFSMLARRHAQESKSEELTQPRLIHSVTTPIIEQIVNLASKGTGGTLTVLSPFHDTDGKAVKRLADGVGATKIRVALPTRHASETTFPFHVAKSWSFDLSAVTPEVESPNRCLHAKWFQIDNPDSETITVIGSINATNKALCSIDNIEVGVLRSHLPELGYVTWENSPIPEETTTPSYTASGLGNKFILYAVLSNNGSLTGWLIAAANVAGTWDGFLESGNGEQCAISVIVDDTGRFTSSITAKENLLFATGLQISLTKDDRNARGWVAQEDILKLGRDQRIIIRFLNDEDTIDDEVALIDYLALSVNRHAPQFGSPIKITHHENEIDGRGDGYVPVTIHLSDIAPVLEISSNEEEIAKPEYHSGEFDLFARLRRYLLGERQTSHKEPKILGIEHTEDDDRNDQKEEAAKKKRITNRLDAFETCVCQCLQESHDLIRRRAALVYWFEVKLHMLKRHNWNEEALIFVRKWFWCACAEKLILSPFEALEQHLFTAAAVYALTLLDDSRQLHLVMIHEGLERFAGGPVDRKLVSNILIDHPEVGFASFLAPSRETKLAGALNEVLDTTTLRTELATELGHHEACLGVNGDLIIFKSDIGREFLATLKKRPGVKCYRLSTPAVPSCPFCYTMFSVKAEYDLKYRRIAQCSQCSRFAVNLVP